MTDQLIPINIVIADRTYRIKARVKDEESIRKTVKFLNDKMLEFKTQFAGKDMQDYLAMVVIWYATQNAEDKKINTDDLEIKEGLKKISDILQELH